MGENGIKVKIQFLDNYQTIKQDHFRTNDIWRLYIYQKLVIIYNKITKNCLIG